MGLRRDGVFWESLPGTWGEVLGRSMELTGTKHVSCVQALAETLAS